MYKDDKNPWICVFTLTSTSLIISAFHFASRSAPFEYKNRKLHLQFFHYYILFDRELLFHSRHNISCRHEDYEKEAKCHTQSWSSWFRRCSRRVFHVQWRTWLGIQNRRYGCSSACRIAYRISTASSHDVPCPTFSSNSCHDNTIPNTHESHHYFHRWRHRSRDIEGTQHDAAAGTTREEQTLPSSSEVVLCRWRTSRIVIYNVWWKACPSREKFVKTSTIFSDSVINNSRHQLSYQRVIPTQKLFQFHFRWRNNFSGPSSPLPCLFPSSSTLIWIKSAKIHDVLSIDSVLYMMLLHESLVGVK